MIRNQDWRADGNRFNQNAKKRFEVDGDVVFRYYFKLKTGPDTYSDDFKKFCFSCPSSYPNRILIWYEGDETSVVDFCHGNVTDTKKAISHIRTAPSVLEKMKEKKNQIPFQVYQDMKLSAPTALYRHSVEAPRNLQQVRNATKNARMLEKLSSDTLCNLVEVGTETKFVSDLQVFPDVLVICYREGTIILNYIFE